MIKTFVVVAALTPGLIGYAVAQQAPPAPPAHHLPPHHPLRHLPPHHPLRHHRPPHHPTLQHGAAPAHTP